MQWPLQLALIATVVGVTGAVYSPVLSARALSIDDDQYVTDNYLIQHPGGYSTWRFWREVTPSTVRGYYQPLTMMSLMVDSALGGRAWNLRPYHATNLVLHAANAALIAVLLQLLFRQPWLAAMGGLVFGLHPMTVQTVAWIGERKTLLSTFFALWCLVLYVRYTRDAGRWGYVAALGAYVLAMLSKPIALPVAFLLPVLDYWPLRRLSKQALWEKLPFFAAAALFALVTIRSQAESASINAERDREMMTLLLRPIYVSMLYLEKMIWPIHVSAFYAVPRPVSLSNPMILAVIAGAVLLAIAIAVSLRWTRGAVAGFAFYMLALFPTLGFIGYTWVEAADKYAYFPAIGLVIMIGGLLAYGWRKLNAAGRGAMAAILLAAIAIEGYLVQRHAALWQDTERLARYMLTFTPNSAGVHLQLGEGLAAQGRLDEAEARFRHAINLDPHGYDAWIEVGDVLARQGRVSEAAVAYRDATRGSHNCPALLSRLAKSLAVDERSGARELAEAVAAAERACSLTRYHDPAALDSLAIAYAAVGRYANAYDLGSRAVVGLRGAVPTEVVKQAEARLELYRAGQPYRGPAMVSAQSH